ncbi:hypothetical protein [Pseudoalteromonas rubra]|uniref:Uncharacterized protein n=1 Tax=Pseudoalteromonas rubra TaxID=43658 RepID=A0A0F4QM55_9GAMM|nr:hypothetical protein [Pseudoalteromonas rubra]KJZ08350.1 hypothetical protein TW77_13165 [Pseudoalteromonas rubra]
MKLRSLLIAVTFTFSVYCHAGVKEFLVYDEDIKKLLVQYRKYGGDSTSILLYDKEFDLHSLAKENFTHIKADLSNLEPISHGKSLYRVYRNKNSWTLNEFIVKEFLVEPLKYIASCVKGYGNGRVYCTFRLNFQGKGYQFTLLGEDIILANELVKVLPKLIGEH